MMMMTMTKTKTTTKKATRKKETLNRESEQSSGDRYTLPATKSCSCSAMQDSVGYSPPTSQHDRHGDTCGMKTKRKEMTATQAQDMMQWDPEAAEDSGVHAVKRSTRRCQVNGARS